jgi:hypothetical protein
VVSNTALRFRLGVTPLAQFDVEIREIVQPLLDLIEEIGPRAALVFVAQFENHLAESPDRPHRMVRIILADGMSISGRVAGLIIAWQLSTSSRVRAAEKSTPLRTRNAIMHPLMRADISPDPTITDVVSVDPPTPGDHSRLIIGLEKRQQVRFIERRHLQFNGAIRL